jgi:DNA excision repair protein ERCC-2
MKRIALAVREFALPVPRVGSIEAHSGYGRASAEGMEIHARVQAKRLAQNPEYRAELPLRAEFPHADTVFEVSGRADGFVGGEKPRIEEIKSTFNLHELERKLVRGGMDHPYRLQLLTYGYFYRREHGVTPRLIFHLVSSRSGSSQELEIGLDTDEYESWLERRLDELVEEAALAEKRSARRRKVAVSFPFPFDNPRPGQQELGATVRRAMESKKRLLIQAPTGLGKTVGVLHPMLSEALSRGQRVIYVTPKNSQHAVAEDAVKRFQDAGAKIKSLTLTAKSKICMKNEPLCNPDYCEFARDHYTKISQNDLLGQLKRKRNLGAPIFRELAEQYQVCPFELQLECAAEADVVIGDYNHVFAPRTALGRVDTNSVGQTGSPNLLIDEAHNLFPRALDYYSPALSTLALEKMRQAARLLPTSFSWDAERLIDECITTVIECRPEGDAEPKTTLIDPPAEIFLEQDERLRAFLSRYLDADVEIQPRDVVLRLCFYWSEFTAALGFVAEPKRPEFFTTYQPHAGGGGTVKITCCDASAMLRDTYSRYEHAVGFSATLKPFDYYAKLSGLDPASLDTAEFGCPFPTERRKLLIIPEISTKYSQRDRNAQKIAEAIRRIAAVRPGNYFAFFPSFEFLGKVRAVFAPPPGFQVIEQAREMRVEDINAVVEHLRRRDIPSLVFAVQGGVFAEGVDYPGETVIGAFIVGPPLPVFDLEREEMRSYYQRNYRAGFDYAYTFPAMAKTIQAAGRVIRSETDRGLIVLMDNRFLDPAYSRTMPSDWFDTSPRELVSRQILREVQEFWDRDPST